MTASSVHRPTLHCSFYGSHCLRHCQKTTVRPLFFRIEPSFCQKRFAALTSSSSSLLFPSFEICQIWEFLLKSDIGQSNANYIITRLPRYHHRFTSPSRQQLLQFDPYSFSSSWIGAVNSKTKTQTKNLLHPAKHKRESEIFCFFRLDDILKENPVVYWMLSNHRQPWMQDQCLCITAGSSTSLLAGTLSSIYGTKVIKSPPHFISKSFLFTTSPKWYSKRLSWSRLCCYSKHFSSPILEL